MYISLVRGQYVLLMHAYSFNVGQKMHWTFTLFLSIISISKIKTERERERLRRKYFVDKFKYWSIRTYYKVRFPLSFVLYLYNLTKRSVNDRIIAPIKRSFYQYTQINLIISL